MYNIIFIKFITHYVSSGFSIYIVKVFLSILEYSLTIKVEIRKS